MPAAEATRFSRVEALVCVGRKGAPGEEIPASSGIAVRPAEVIRFVETAGPTIRIGPRGSVYAITLFLLKPTASAASLRCVQVLIAERKQRPPRRIPALSLRAV